MRRTAQSSPNAEWAPNEAITRTSSTITAARTRTRRVFSELEFTEISFQLMEMVRLSRRCSGLSALVRPGKRGAKAVLGSGVPVLSERQDPHAPARGACMCRNEVRAVPLGRDPLIVDVEVERELVTLGIDAFEQTQVAEKVRSGMRRQERFDGMLISGLGACRLLGRAIHDVSPDLSSSPRIRATSAGMTTSTLDCRRTLRAAACDLLKNFSGSAYISAIA